MSKSPKGGKQRHLSSVRILACRDHSDHSSEDLILDNLQIIAGASPKKEETGGPEHLDNMLEQLDDIKDVIAKSPKKPIVRGWNYETKSKVNSMKNWFQMTLAV